MDDPNIPNEITQELDLNDTHDIIKQSRGPSCNKNSRGVFGNDLRFAYRWNKNYGNLVGYDASNGFKFGEYTFGDNLKEEAYVEALAEFENDADLACCAVTYRDRGLLCCVDLSLSKVVHSIKIKKMPITCLAVIKNGNSGFTDKHRVHPQLRAAKGIVAAGQVGGKIFLIDMAAKHTNWWKHNEVNPTSLTLIHAQDCEDQNILQRAVKTSQIKGDHLAIVLDGSLEVPSVANITALEFCEEPMILIVGYDTGNFDIWSLVNLQRIHTGELVGAPITHIMSMLPEEDPRKLVYIWVADDGMTDGLTTRDSVIATANLYVLSYKPKHNESNATGYEEIDTVNCMFRLLFDSVDKHSKNADYSTCLAVSPISIDISNKYMSALNCTGLCSFVWSGDFLNSDGDFCPVNYYAAIFDLGRWYAEEMPKEAYISDLQVRQSSYLANSHLQIANPDKAILLDAKVCTNDTKKYIWPLNEEVTSYVAATSFSMMAFTSEKIYEFSFPGIQSYLFDQIDNLPLFELMFPKELFKKCLSAGLMPDGVYSRKKEYSKKEELEAIYELAVNHNLLRFLRRCASEFFDGKYENGGLSTQHLFEWAWSKALDAKSKSDELIGLLYSGQELTASDKNCHYQYVDDLFNITQLFQHVEKERLLHTAEALNGLHLRIKGLNLVNEYLKCVQYFSSSLLLPNTMENGQQRMKLLKEEYLLRRQREHCLMIDLLVERFGNELTTLWLSHGGNGKYPPPSMQSILAVLLLDTANHSDKHCLLLYFLLDWTKSFNMNTSLDLGYKEMTSTLECSQQVTTAQFLWYIDHNKLQDALKCVETEKLDATWIDSTYNHLYNKCNSKELFDTYRCIGFGTDTLDKKKFVIHLFVENGLIIPGFQWARKNCISGFEPQCFAYFLECVRGANGLGKLVAKELNLKPKESMMLYEFLKMHRIDALTEQLEEKIGTANFVPCPEVSNSIFTNISDFEMPEVFCRNRLPAIESEEVQKLIKGSFVFVKPSDSTPLQRIILPQMSKPSILKASDSPAGSPLHLSSAMTPSPKRLRFQLPKNVELSSSSDDSSPVSEGLLHYEFETPKASTPKSAEPIEALEETFYEFSVPSEAPQIHRLDDENPRSLFDSPIISSSLATEASQFEPSSTQNIKFDSILHTSTPIEDDSIEEENLIIVAATDAKTCNEEPAGDNEMLTDEEECDVKFVSVISEPDEQNQVAEILQPAAPVSLSNVMEISEDEDDVAANSVKMVEHNNAANNESFISTANESFFSTAGGLSPNTSTISYASALDSTLKEDDLDLDESQCPVTKKRKSEVFDDSITTFENSVDVGNLSSEDLSPSKFWQPPVLEKISNDSEPEVDLSYLPKPPLRPSPRRPIRGTFQPNTYHSIADESLKDNDAELIQGEALKESHTCEKESNEETSINEGSFSIQVSSDLTAEGQTLKIESTNLSMSLFQTTAEGDACGKKYDSIFHRTIDTTLERDLQELEAEQDLKESDDDSDHDTTLEKTIIVLSSGSSLDSPVKLTRKSFALSRSPMKTIKKEQMSPKVMEELQPESEMPSTSRKTANDELLPSPLKRYTRSDRLKEENISVSAPEFAVPMKASSVNLPQQISGLKSEKPKEEQKKNQEGTVEKSTENINMQKESLATTKELEPAKKSAKRVKHISGETSVLTPPEGSQLQESLDLPKAVHLPPHIASTTETSQASKIDLSDDQPILARKPATSSDTIVAPEVMDTKSKAKEKSVQKSLKKAPLKSELTKKIDKKATESKTTVQTKKTTVKIEKQDAARNPSLKPRSAALKSATTASHVQPAGPALRRKAAEKTKLDEKPVVKSTKSAGKRKMSDDEVLQQSPSKSTRSKTTVSSSVSAPSVASSQEEVPSKISRRTKVNQSKQLIDETTALPEKSKLAKSSKKTESDPPKLTTKNLKKFEQQMKSAKDEAPSSSQESSTSSPRKGRPRRITASSASDRSSASPEIPRRELRSRSRSVVSEIVAPRPRRRSSSVVSDKSVNSQKSTRSTRSVKRKMEADSDNESTGSGMELRKSSRRIASSSKRTAGRKVSIIPEEKD